MARFRFGIRAKLAVLSVFLFTIPWLGYQFVWELESYLRVGQEQTMVGTARAIATALHERPSLFDSNAAYLTDVRPGTDLYAHPIIDPIRLDGRLADWQDYQRLTLAYGEQNLLRQQQPFEQASLSFRHMVGRYNQYLYAMFDVTDDNLVFRNANSLRVDRNDFLQISLTDQQGVFRRYIVAPKSDGWVNAFLLDDDINSLRPVSPETRIQGYWATTGKGYNVELRFPLTMLSGSIAFAITDVDDLITKQQNYTIGTADPWRSDLLGTVLVPSPQIEKILSSLKYANSRVWVVDKHKRVLARAGDIQAATGLSAPSSEPVPGDGWEYVEQQWLLPLYYRILTRPPKDFVDELEDAYALQGNEIQQALQGNPASLWRLTPDNKAVVLSAAHPIYINEQVMGAVIVEQTTHGIRTVRNRALERLFHVILAVMGLGTLALLLFASRISSRIRRLRNQTEQAIDQNGKIIGQIPASSSGDEIGDLSRTFNNVLSKLAQYNAYLENMASRLSHELRTPVAIVNSSLDNLSIRRDSEDQDVYIERARSGIQRLSRILTNMSEATRLEQAFQHTELEPVALHELLPVCVESYQSAYPDRRFSLELAIKTAQIAGSADLFVQMLDKIITNAVEFSPADSEIALRLYQHKHFIITVSNHGAPLPDDMQSQLFDSMVSVRAADSDNNSHLGLGLYVAKLIAQFHRGSIDIANSEDGQGVCVSLSFPPNTE